MKRQPVHDPDRFEDAFEESGAGRPADIKIRTRQNRALDAVLMAPKEFEREQRRKRVANQRASLDEQVVEQGVQIVDEVIDRVVAEAGVFARLAVAAQVVGDDVVERERIALRTASRPRNYPRRHA